MSEIQVGQINSTDGSTAITTGAGGTVTLSAALTSGGALAMGANNISFSNGNGIDFSASEGSDATSSVLNDYEEGNFTPYLSNESGTDLIGTYGEQYGTYAKIGERVYFTIRCTSGSALSGSAGELRVQGLPYVQSASGFESYIAMYMWFYSGLGGISSGDVLIARGQVDSTFLVIQKLVTGAGESVTNSDFGNSLNMSIAGHYKTPS